MKLSAVLFCLVSFACERIDAIELTAETTVVDDELHHIRNGREQEWSGFPATQPGSSYNVSFSATANSTEQTLCLRQSDVKQTWGISLNEKQLGLLHRDENSIVGYWSIPKETLIDGENVLTVTTSAKASDDIRIGHVEIINRPLDSVLNAAQLEVRVRDAATGRLTPCRITVIRRESLMTLGASSTDEMAVRPGVIYCKGTAAFGIPAGEYNVVAGRGPEYSIDQRSVIVHRGESRQIELTIRREVPTDGFVACDTHVHTLTHSGHGDSTIRERMLTLAGEGLELPIATDHNVHISYDDLAEELGVRSFFTPVIGNEVTTKLGHFNVFPIASAATPIPDYKADNWNAIFESIFATPEVKVAILNHARDIHSNFRPFGPEHHIAVTGRNQDGWTLRANAVEVINSAAQQTDMLRLVHDWMGMLNSGTKLTPVGCSDSHDVARHFVGQGRTYIRCNDSDPGKIPVNEAVTAFLEGRVTVSCGLFADIRINTDFHIGDTVPQADIYQAEIDVKGPSWIEAHQVQIFVNGISVTTVPLSEEERSRHGVKATISTMLPVSAKQDAFVVAVARGPGVTKLHWPIAKPYQPTSANWTPYCMAVTGAVWIDADGDGRMTSAKQYAQQLCETAGNNPLKVVQALTGYDRAVAIHAAAALMELDEDSFVPHVLPITRSASDGVRQAFQEYLDLWQQSQRARAGAER